MKAKITGVALIIGGLTAVFMALFIMMPALRPYLIIVVAVLGTLLPAWLPDLFKNSRFLRLLTAVVASVCVGIGTAYTVIETKNAEADYQRKLSLQASLLGSLSELPAASLDQVLLHLAGRMRNTFGEQRADRFADVAVIADIMLSVSRENGHGLYYKGEAYRITKDFENMRGMFERYLAMSDKIAGAREGVAADGYARPYGYFGERTAYIMHLMANDAYRQTAATADPLRIRRLLNDAERSAIAALQLWREVKRDESAVFKATESNDSTDVLLEKIARRRIGIGG